MALAKEPTPHELGMGSVQLQQGCLIYGNVVGGSAIEGVSDLSSLPVLSGLDDDSESEKSSRATAGYVMAHPMRHTSSTTCGASSRTPDCNAIRPMSTTYQVPQEAPSGITFKPRYENFMHNSTTGSLLSFEQNDRTSQTTYTKVCHEHHDYFNWEDNLNYDYQIQLNPILISPNPDRMLDLDFNCFPASGYGSMRVVNTSKENQHGEESLGWLYTEAEAVTDNIDQEFAATKESCFNKRPYTGETMQTLKRQCTAAARKSRPKSIPSKDPQSIAAKNRRERISERLKILQDLVPNGSKVDLVTMLEKAISYVKFLQLQVKVLATDEFWPVQGGKAPDISQVKEAIDAILLSQRDSNSSSK